MTRFAALLFLSVLCRDAAAQTPVDVFLIVGDSIASGYGGNSAQSTTVPAPGRVLQVYGGTISNATDPVGNANTGSMWPAFGATYNTMTGRVVAFVPSAIPGASQASINDLGYGNWDVSGSLWMNSVASLDAALVLLIQNGYAPTVAGLLYENGNNDSANGDMLAFRTSLTNMIQRYRSLYGSRLPIFVWLVGQRCGSQVGLNPKLSLINAQIKAVANGDSGVIIVYRGALDFPARGLLNADCIHWNQTGMNEAGAAGGAATGVFLGQAPSSEE